MHPPRISETTSTHLVP